MPNCQKEWEEKETKEIKTFLARTRLEGQSYYKIHRGLWDLGVGEEWSSTKVHDNHKHKILVVEGANQQTRLRKAETLVNRAEMSSSDIRWMRIVRKGANFRLVIEKTAEVDLTYRGV